MRRLLIPALATLLVSAPAFAHPKIVSSTPAAQSTVAPLSRIEINFSEKLLAPMAGATLTMTDMPGMATHAPMAIRIATSVAPDGHTLIAVAPKPLPKGGYTLAYHVVSADTHRVEGELSFKVQ
jgi:hypothetical protein